MSSSMVKSVFISTKIFEKMSTIFITVGKLAMRHLSITLSGEIIYVACFYDGYFVYKKRQAMDD